MNRFSPALAAAVLSAATMVLHTAGAGAQPAADTAAKPAAASASPAAAATPQPAAAPRGPLLGIALAAPIGMPACPAGAADAAAPAGTRCYVEESFRGEKRLRVNLPAGELPSWASAVRVLTDARSGLVETIRIHTTGIRVQRPVMLALIQQYGKPTSTSAVKVQDSKGMALDSLLARWQTPAAVVEYQSMTGEADDGLVTIRTPQTAQGASTQPQGPAPGAGATR